MKAKVKMSIGQKQEQMKREKQVREMRRRLRVYNIVSAGILVLGLLMYFFDFFNLDIDGDIQNRISGFRLSFLLGSGELNDSNNILSLLSKDNYASIAFAAVSSCIALFVLILLVCLLVYRGVKKLPVLSVSVLIVMSVLFVALIVQMVACSMLAAIVEEHYYSSCSTCRVQSFAFLPLIIFILATLAYLTLALISFSNYKITFKL